MQLPRSWSRPANLGAQARNGIETSSIISSTRSAPSFSVQGGNGNDDTTYPEIGIFVKKSTSPETDFKPAITAIIEAALPQKAYTINSAVVTELNYQRPGFRRARSLSSRRPSCYRYHHRDRPVFRHLFLGEPGRAFLLPGCRFDPSCLTTPISAVRSGTKRNGASQIGFVDTPHPGLDRALSHRDALPVDRFCPCLTRTSPPLAPGQEPAARSDLARPPWAPGRISSLTPDNEGLQGYSVSGIGNQGILMAFAGAGGYTVAQRMGTMEVPNPSQFNSNSLSGQSKRVAPITQP